MFSFYKIENGSLVVGQGKNIPEGFKPYDPENQPEELVIAQTVEDEAVKKAECIEYLNATDWYYARKLEIGLDIPDEIRAKRIEARAYLNK